MRDYLGKTKELYFAFPIDGDCLNSYDGEETAGSLTIMARIVAPRGRQITVNGCAAKWNGEYYVCPVCIANYKTVITAVDSIGKQTAITVYRFNNAVGRYRISSDDNILFLKDINDHRDTYRSIFENPYLAIYKKAHDLYGACVHINIYYEYGEEEMVDFSAQKEPFNLSMMTDKFKSEWQQNAHWLKLSFHARKNYPDAPYLNADADEVMRDAEAVHREILRFAGAEVLPPVTTLHFGASNLQGTRALRRLGYRCLAGYFELTKQQKTLVSYHYPQDLVQYVGNRDFWKDTQEDIIFARIDCVLNYPEDPAVTIQELEKIAKNKNRAGFLSLMMHEEYFYKDYKNHRERFEELVLEPCRWCYEHGYSGALLSNIVFEGGK